VKRTKDIKTARNLAMYIIRQVTDLSLNSIGVMFDRDHSTIHSNITAVEKQLKTDAALDSEIADIRREIKK
ncbi:MAG: chromosomal replication initiator protein DnaA, partial [Clostridia bacterium]|nr:chromosomal replication initiator protein DnaA [Clostridia bacterium]